MQDVFFYEAFEERSGGDPAASQARMRAEFTGQDDSGVWRASPGPPAVVSVRTQFALSADWKPGSFAILTRSTGLHHVAAYRRRTGARWTADTCRSTAIARLPNRRCCSGWPCSGGCRCN